ncbi:Aste57867_18721 [Aphanomyces stellatus]|uniref:Aste57867_18721 protein n=1 Tax=Aphanomyces stellatus TaxID=120398 RepID=A0A485LBP8_9STRA|nr:hypothetical protein As57867_018657 [Aphanomyces stellatus]VFT95455.1 Aste57867_18721 [Aphanomyces stellatus]
MARSRPVSAADSSMHKMHPSPDKVDARRAKRRARSMLSQRRYRATQKASNTQLQADVELLEQTTVRLEAHLSVLHDRRGVGECVAAMREYVRLFERGYSPASQDPRLTQRQVAFLNNFVSPALQFDGEGGADVMLDGWIKLTTSFGSVRNELVAIDLLSVNDDDNTIRFRVAACLHLEMNASTVQKLFPHQVHRASLVAKLVGKTLRLDAGASVAFDATTKQMTRLDCESNVAAALVAQLQSIEDAVEALQGELATESLFGRLQQLTLEETGTNDS